MNFMHFEKKGFTLAEVLITLAVIGVVAALTVPVIVKNAQEAGFKTAFKRNYQLLQEATKLVMLDNDNTLIGVCLNNGSDCFAEKYAKYLKYAQRCNNGSTLGECWHLNDGSTKYLDGVTEYNSWYDGVGFKLMTGAFYSFAYLNANCNRDYAPMFVCGAGHIDVNGFKGPNIIGKDIFSVWIDEDGIHPYGANDAYTSNTYCTTGSSSSSSNGIGCAAKVLRNIDY